MTAAGGIIPAPLAHQEDVSHGIADRLLQVSLRCEIFMQQCLL